MQSNTLIRVSVQFVRILDSMDAQTPATSALMIHGLGSRGRDLSLVSAALRPIETVCPDLIGHGVRADGKVESIDDFAADLQHSTSLPGRFVLIGLSFGAAVAMSLWRLMPERVEGVVLVDPPLDVWPLIVWAREESGGLVRRVRAIPRCRSFHEVSDLVRSGGSRYSLRKLYRCNELGEAVEQMRSHPMLAGLSESQLEMNARSLIQADNELMLGALEFNPRWSDARRPQTSDAPIVVAFGTRSIVCPERAAAELADRLGGETRQLDSGHCPQFEDPEGLATIISSLIESRSS